MSDDKLKCPACESTGLFSITAEMTLTVSSGDFLLPLGEDDDRWYGDESLCVCKKCGHRAHLKNFKEVK